MLDAAGFLEQSLLEDESLTPAELAEAHHFAKETGSTVCAALISLGHVDSRTIALTKAQIWETPFIDLKQFEIRFQNARLLPKTMAEKNLVFPLFNLRGVVTLGMDDPLNLSVLDDVRQILKCEIEPVQCETQILEELIAKAYGLGLGAEEGAAANAEVIFAAHADDGKRGPIIVAVNTILNDAVRCQASDVHLNPDESLLHIRFRIDGQLQTRQGPSLAMYTKIVQRLKVMAQLDLTQSRRPQDGKFRFNHGSQTIDVRMSVLPTVDGENVVLRLLAGHGRIARYEELGMSNEMRSDLNAILRHPYGMLLVTGPTGSGKTTTLYSILGQINEPSRNILTVEDPVEIRMPLVRQIQVNHEIGMTFASALRSILRQDPDVILIGEIRDEETAEIALQSALTGHFVMSTLHTNDAAGAIARLMDLNQPSFVINSALLGVIAQRLVRQVCRSCSVPDHPDAEVLELLELADDVGLKYGEGCAQCLQTGFRGRIGIYELLQLSPTLKEAIGADATTDEIRRRGAAEGMRLMWQDGRQKAQYGQTSVSEILRTVQVAEIRGGHHPTDEQSPTALESNLAPGNAPSTSGVQAA